MIIEWSGNWLYSKTIRIHNPTSKEIDTKAFNLYVIRTIKPYSLTWS